MPQKPIITELPNSDENGLDGEMFDMTKNANEKTTTKMNDHASAAPVRHFITYKQPKTN